MSLFTGLADLLFGAGDPTPAHYEGDYDLTTRGDGAMWRLRAYRELGERDARRRARAGRWRRSWPHKAAGAVRSILQRRDRGRTGPPAPPGRIMMRWPRVWREEPPGAESHQKTMRARMEVAALAAAVRAQDEERRKLPPFMVEEARPAESVYEALTHAQLVARQAGQTELADALHALILLDLTGNLADVAPLVTSVRASLQSALGDDPRAIN